MLKSPPRSSGVVPDLSPVPVTLKPSASWKNAENKRQLAGASVQPRPREKKTGRGSRDSRSSSRPRGRSRRSPAPPAPTSPRSPPSARSEPPDDTEKETNPTEAKGKGKLSGKVKGKFQSKGEDAFQSTGGKHSSKGHGKAKGKDKGKGKDAPHRSPRSVQLAKQGISIKAASEGTPREKDENRKDYRKRVLQIWKGLKTKRK